RPSVLTGVLPTRPDEPALDARGAEALEMLWPSWQRLVRFVVMHGVTRSDAEELASETLIRVASAYNRRAGPSWSYLVPALRSQLVDTHRRSARESRVARRLALL